MNHAGIRTRPIASWPGPMTTQEARKNARYKAHPNTTRDDLMRELELIGATDAFLQAAYREDQIRLDGLPRAGAEPDDPGVIVTYTLDGQMYDMPCDAFESAEQNLRAIVLVMQRLRLIDDTGVRTHGRQYEGFKRLPGGEPHPADRVAAAKLLAEYSNHIYEQILSRTETARAAYLHAVKLAHPDRGGNALAFERVFKAGETLNCNGRSSG